MRQTVCALITATTTRDSGSAAASRTRWNSFYPSEHRVETRIMTPARRPARWLHSLSFGAKIRHRSAVVSNGAEPDRAKADKQTLFARNLRATHVRQTGGPSRHWFLPRRQLQQLRAFRRIEALTGTEPLKMAAHAETAAVARLQLSQTSTVIVAGTVCARGLTENAVRSPMRSPNSCAVSCLSGGGTRALRPR